MSRRENPDPPVTRSYDPIEADSGKLLGVLQERLRARFSDVTYIDGDPLSVFCEAATQLATHLRQERISADRHWWVDFWKTILSTEPEGPMPTEVVLAIGGAQMRFAANPGQELTLEGESHRLKVLKIGTVNGSKLVAVYSDDLETPLRPIDPDASDDPVQLTMSTDFPELSSLGFRIDAERRDTIEEAMGFFLEGPTNLLQAFSTGTWHSLRSNGDWHKQEVVARVFPHGLFLLAPCSRKLRCVFGVTLAQIPNCEVRIHPNAVLAEVLGEDGVTLDQRPLKFQLGGESWHAKVLDQQPGRHCETDDSFIARCARRFRSFGVEEASEASLITPREIRSGILSHFPAARWVESFALQERLGSCVRFVAEPQCSGTDERLDPSFPARLVESGNRLLPDIVRFLQARRPVGWDTSISGISILPIEIKNIDPRRLTILRRCCCDLTKPVLMKRGEDPKEVLHQRLNDEDASHIDSGFSGKLLCGQNHGCDDDPGITLVWPVHRQ